MWISSLLDLHMLGPADGEDFLFLLRDRGDELPIIIVSGWVDKATTSNQPDCVDAVSAGTCRGVDRHHAPGFGPVLLAPPFHACKRWQILGVDDTVPAHRRGGGISRLEQTGAAHLIGG